MKIFVVGNAHYYASWIKDATLVDTLSEADVVLFTGGEDVSPSLYGATPHPTTYSNLSRDEAEKKIFDSMTSKQIALGICRGSQFLCVMNGGKLVQNVYNHAIFGTHPITNGSKTFEITSTHHQMQFPFNLKDSCYEILYYAKGLSYGYEGISMTASQLSKLQIGEPEVVLYTVKNKPTCLAIQGHPEMMRPTAPIIEELNSILSNLLNR